MDRNFNNKGFTLVELLSVMVILISISLIAVASITSSLERRENKECEEQVYLVRDAAKIYFSLNTGTDEVSLEVLINEGYISKEKLSMLEVDKVSVNMALTVFGGC